MGDSVAGPVPLYSPRFHSSATVALALIDVNQRGSIGPAADTTLRQQRTPVGESFGHGLKLSTRCADFGPCPLLFSTR